MSATEVGTVTIEVDGREVIVPKGTPLVLAAASSGVEIPIFCYEPRLGPAVGACRMCLVEIEGMPKLQAACTLTVADGMKVHTRNERASDAQRAVLEFLVLGPVEVRRDGKPVAIPRGKTAELLVHLALAAGTPVRADRLLDDLWAGTPTNRNTLQQKVARLRRSLGDPSLLTGGDDGYRLAVEPAAVDAHRVLLDVDAATALPAEIRVYEKLFKSPRPEDGGSDFTEHIDRDSKQIISTARIEASVATAAVGDRFQFVQIQVAVLVGVELVEVGEDQPHHLGPVHLPVAPLAAGDHLAGEFLIPEAGPDPTGAATVPVASNAVATNNLIAQIAMHEHAVFIDPIREHWMTRADARAFRSHIPGHPNNAGHAYIAQRLLMDLAHRSDGTIGGGAGPTR